MSSASDLFREVLALGDRVRGLGQRVSNLGARVDEVAVCADDENTAARKGMIARGNGQSERYNPYRPGTQESKDWLYGYNSGSSKTKTDADKKPAEGGKYNASAVQKEIEKDKRIKPGEAKLIHGLLKGWRKDEDKADSGSLVNESTVASAVIEVKNVAKNMFSGDLRKGLTEWKSDHPDADSGTINQIKRRLGL